MRGVQADGEDTPVGSDAGVGDDAEGNGGGVTGAGVTEGVNAGVNAGVEEHGGADEGRRRPLSSSNGAGGGVSAEVDTQHWGSTSGEWDAWLLPEGGPTYDDYNPDWDDPDDGPTIRPKSGGERARRGSGSSTGGGAIGVLGKLARDLVDPTHMMQSTRRTALSSGEDELLSVADFVALDSPQHPDYQRPWFTRWIPESVVPDRGLQWVISLLMVPVLVDFGARSIIVQPLMRAYVDNHPEVLRLRPTQREEAGRRLVRLRESFEFERYLLNAPGESVAARFSIRAQAPMEAPGLLDELSGGRQTGRKAFRKTGGGKDEVEKDAMSSAEDMAIRKEALRLAHFFEERNFDSLCNVIADFLAGFSLVVVLADDNRRVVRVGSSLLRNWFFDLNEQTQAFMLLLLTDVFVGYHSSDGWAALLEMLAEHFGLHVDRIGADVFIATVPVLVDVSIKFWVFTALRSRSPATGVLLEELHKQ